MCSCPEPCQSSSAPPDLPSFFPSQEHFAFSRPSPAASRSISALSAAASARAPSLCVLCTRLSLSFFICRSSATSDDLFHPIWNSTSCSTVTVCAKHTFYMPSVLKEKKPQERLFRKWQNSSPLWCCRKLFTLPHICTQKYNLVSESSMCFVHTRNVTDPRVSFSLHSGHGSCCMLLILNVSIYVTSTSFLHMLLSFYPRACCVSLCFSANFVHLFISSAHKDSITLLLLFSLSYVPPHGIFKNVKSKSLICPIYLLSAELSQSH